VQGANNNIANCSEIARDSFVIEFTMPNISRQEKQSRTLGKQATFHAIQVWWILPPDSTAPHLALNHPMISIVAAGCSHDMLSRFLSTP
jgi:hypothetical protein